MRQVLRNIKQRALETDEDDEVLDMLIVDFTKKKDSNKEDGPLTMQVLLCCAPAPVLGDSPSEGSPSGHILP